MIRRRTTVSAVVAAAVLGLSACGTNFSAQTNQQYQAAEGANQRGEVDAMNTVLVADEDGTGVLAAGLVNKTDSAQKLTGVTITTSDGKQLTVDAPAEAVTVPAGKIVSLGQADTDAFSVPEGAAAGRYVTVTFSFSNAQDTVVEAPSAARSDTYENIVKAG